MPINIFISSRMEGVEKEKRKLAKEAIKEMGDAFKPILFEDEPPDSKHTRDWWRDKIKDENTKFMILILNGIFHIRTSPILVVSVEHYFLFLRLFSFFLVATCVSR